MVVITHRFHHIKTYVFKQNISSRLALNEFLSETQSGLKSVLQTNYLPDIHFPFSIFHFQFKISVRASLFLFLRNYLLKLTAAVYCTVTVIVTLDVLLSASVTEYVTLYLPFRVVITLPKTSIFDVMSLPQVSTAVTPARA